MLKKMMNLKKDREVVEKLNLTCKFHKTIEGATAEAIDVANMLMRILNDPNRFEVSIEETWCFTYYVSIDELA